MFGRLYGLLVALAVFALSAAPLSAEEPKPPAGSAEASAKLYASKCLLCHGKDGIGNKALGVLPWKDPKVLKQYDTPEKLKKAITDGVKPGKGQKLAMPPYKGKLKPQEVDDLVAYMWQLQHPKTGATAK